MGLKRLILIFLSLAFSSWAFGQDVDPLIYSLRIINGLDGEPFAVMWEYEKGQYGYTILNRHIAETLLQGNIKKAASSLGTRAAEASGSTIEATGIAALLAASGYTVYKLGKGDWDGGYIQKAGCQVKFKNFHLTPCPSSTLTFEELVKRKARITIDTVRNKFNGHDYGRPNDKCNESGIVVGALSAFDKSRGIQFKDVDYVGVHPGVCKSNLGVTRTCGLVLDFNDETKLRSFNSLHTLHTARTSNGEIPVCGEIAKPKSPQPLTPLQESTKELRGQ